MTSPPALETRPAAPLQQRADGEARLRFVAGGGRTRLADLYQRAPCRVLFPLTAQEAPAEAVLLTTSGGLTGGDRIRTCVEAGVNAQLTVTTQAAEKIYRAVPGSEPARVEVRLDLSAGAWVEWLAQETILFEGSRLRRLLAADVDPAARLLAHETVALGRTAMGERPASLHLHDAWRIRCGGRLLWADALHLDGDIEALRRAPFGLGAHTAFASVIYAGPDAARLLGVARSALAAHRLPAGATGLPGLLLARLMADDSLALRRAVTDLLGELRHAAAGLPARLPRVWYC